MKRILAIASFYLINFGLWELLKGYIGSEWDSFLVYVILFPLMIFIFWNELKSEWKEFSSILKTKSFYVYLIIWLVLDLLFTGLLLWGINTFGWDILPQNNNNVKDQMVVVPLYLTMIQGCIFAPVIEELVFRYAIISKTENRIAQMLLFIVSVVMFDCIHIVRLPEFFYYLIPSLFLTSFYMKKKNPFTSIALHSAINVVGYISLIAGIL
ncbi:CPBP family intramembrane glutamic endopeptidase [Butyrivibrio sp. AE3004]|uniref:CPBP family intramembrane glutamic endopeptidase n=1 Tax=Butyrivibrio sp. AE3004 TaxID=1506994 RepID=UPI000494AC0D|nr:type II CAAX endopeptidase family protein [Butyrivibrio sp. AE3004]